MTLHQRLSNNRELLGIPDPSQLPIAQIPPSQVAAILTRTIALLDAVDSLSRQSLDVEFGAVKQLANDVEATIAQAVLEAR